MKFFFELRRMNFLNLKPNNYRQLKSKIIKPEKIGKYPRLFKSKLDLKNNRSKLYTCAFYHVNNKKIYGLITRPHKGVLLVLDSFEKMVNQFVVIKPNSLIHLDNGSEFK